MPWLVAPSRAVRRGHVRPDRRHQRYRDDRARRKVATIARLQVRAIQHFKTCVESNQNPVDDPLLTDLNLLSQESPGISRPRPALRQCVCSSAVAVCYADLCTGARSPGRLAGRPVAERSRGSGSYRWLRGSTARRRRTAGRATGLNAGGHPRRPISPRVGGESATEGCLSMLR